MHEVEPQPFLNIVSKHRDIRLVFIRNYHIPYLLSLRQKDLFFNAVSSKDFAMKGEFSCHREAFADFPVNR